MSFFTFEFLKIAFDVNYSVLSRDTSNGLMCSHSTLANTLSPKFKRVSLNEISEFPFCGFNICVDFDLRDLEKLRM